MALLAGGGVIGHGEDVTYEDGDREAFQRSGVRVDLAGRHTLESFAARLAGTDLFSEPPEDPVSRSYRRWAFESAALDLALRQAGLSLWSVLGRQVRPMSFVASPGLGHPPSLRRIDELLERCPGVRFKVDARSDWDDRFIEALRARCVVACVDLKGHYPGQSIYQPPDPALYARVIDAFPGAWIEDAAETDETRELLDAASKRLAWDAPIRSVEDVRALSHRPGAINVKAARMGSLKAVFDLYDECAAHGIATYGGGDFELGPGRRQSQYLASMFHAAAANDLAPTDLNDDPLPSYRLPAGPLDLEPVRFGFDAMVGLPDA